ncbi:pyridoxal phosphate-dependent decarboxylase family protein [Minwuia sp.]|uniref:pyridoxal phosphate-dependent decarboxylase family protein n=1 Tax=Minwuia sp. TaxID=2493630 RepID=UPI003A8F7303
MARIAFPEHGTDADELTRQMADRTDGDIDWRNGRTPLYVFKGSESAAAVGKAAFMQFFTENALGGKRAFHSIGSMERDVIDMGLDLFHAPDGADGHMTTGGSESIFMAVKAARDTHRVRGSRVGTQLNMVLPESAHPAFDKAARSMEIEVRRVPLQDSLRADPEQMAAAADRQTMMMIASAPCFPFGVIDPVAAISEVAVGLDIWLHVDACVGGYLIPFAKEAGEDLPAFDFEVPGVRSISADLHKYGFCPKPASTLFFRDAGDMARGAFDLDVWANGRFVTQTIAGTRPGGAVAGAWAVLNHLGRQGYRDIARDLMANARAYRQGIEALQGYHMFAEPDLTILSFGARDLDIFAVADRLAEDGWLPGRTQDPRGMHLMLSMFHAPARDAYLADLARATEAVRRDGGSSTSKAVY